MTTQIRNKKEREEDVTYIGTSRESEVTTMKNL